MGRLTNARRLPAYGYVPRMPLVIAPRAGGPGLHHCPAASGLTTQTPQVTGSSPLGPGH